MKLEDIGFYTLSDFRAKNTRWNSNLQRCELILTDRCNFNCQYCRGIKKELMGDLTLDQAKNIVDIWESGRLKNIRLSGGEPTLWPHLVELVKYIKKSKHIEHIAISTNGSCDLEYYLNLVECGVNDFSISLDSCCSMTADLMAGTNAKIEHISNIIKHLSKVTYVTVGIVIDERNADDLVKTIGHATYLGVSDIRVIPSAQSNYGIDLDITTNYKILKYRIENIKRGRNVRGMSENDCRKCHLVKDDMAVLFGYHFPCIIYMREQGEPCGSIYGKTIGQVRYERKEWFEKTDTFNDDICRKNCLDVCVNYNNKVESFNNLQRSET